MLSLFKKKEIKPEVKSMYKAQAVNYLQILEVEDYDKEYLLDYFNKQNKVYSLDDIKLMKDKLGFDIWNAFIWLNIEHINQAKVAVSIEYRLSDTTKSEIIEAIKDHINTKGFYTRKDIQDASRILGFDVWGNCNWNNYSKSIVTLPNEDTSHLYYTKK